MVTLPSGSTISAETWAAIRSGDDWREILDPGMYSQADRDFLDGATKSSGHLDDDFEEPDWHGGYSDASLDALADDAADRD